MAWSCSEQRAICSALAAAPAATTTARSTRRGSPPPTAWPACRPSSRRRPRPSGRCRARTARAPSTATWSLMVTTGKRDPYGLPSGADEPGRSSPGSRRARSGRPRSSGRCRWRTRADQAVPPARARMPRFDRSATWESPVRACRTRTAFEAVAFELAPGLVGDRDLVRWPPASRSRPLGRPCPSRNSDTNSAGREGLPVARPR